jgi:hypothetical protein
MLAGLPSEGEGPLAAKTTTRTETGSSRKAANAEFARMSISIALTREEWDEFRTMARDCGQSLGGRMRYLIVRDIRSAPDGMKAEPIFA